MIQAIETEYNGYRFRSRLEARWAVFMDSMGIDYYYEMEGYTLPDSSGYLPDFWLPEFKMFMEVKGIIDEQFFKVIGLCRGHDNAVIVVGPPSHKGYPGIFLDYLQDHNSFAMSFFYWGQCIVCKEPCLVLQEFDTKNKDKWYIQCKSIECTRLRKSVLLSKHDPAKTPLVLAATQKMLQARFEHGEKPKVLRGKPR